MKASKGGHAMQATPSGVVDQINLRRIFSLSKDFSYFVSKRRLGCFSTTIAKGANGFEQSKK